MMEKKYYLLKDIHQEILMQKLMPQDILEQKTVPF